MLALMCHLLYLCSRLGQTSLVGLNVVPLYVKEQVIKRVALGTPGSNVISTVKKVPIENTKVSSLIVMAVLLAEGVRVREQQRVWEYLQFIYFI